MSGARSDLAATILGRYVTVVEVERERTALEEEIEAVRDAADRLYRVAHRTEDIRRTWLVARGALSNLLTELRAERREVGARLRAAHAAFGEAVERA